MQAQLGTPSTRADGNSGIFPAVAPEECTMPYVVYIQNGLSQIQSMGGINRLQEARFRFSCYATTYLGAKNLANALKGALNGLLTTLSDSTATTVQGLEFVFEEDGVDPDSKGTIYACYLDCQMWFSDNA